MDVGLQNLIDKVNGGDVEAMIEVAKYYHGKNNESKAYEYLEMAAKRGHSVAAYKVGVAYCFGMDVPVQNLELGVKYLQNAADKNIANAQYMLAVVCDNIEGAEAYLKESTTRDAAIFYYEKSAKQGYAAAQNMLGDIYMKGIRVKRDLDKAIFWWGCAYLHNESANQERGSARDRLNSLLQTRRPNGITKSHIETILCEIKTNYPQYLYLNDN